MSLLLEALKKAELAKQAQLGADKAAETTLPLSGVIDLPIGEADSGHPLDITMGSLSASDGKTAVFTRDRLPSIDQPIELVAPDMTFGAIRNEIPTLDLQLEETLPPDPSRPLSGPNLAGAAGGATASAVAGAAALGGGSRTSARPGSDPRQPAAGRRSWESAPEDRAAARQMFEAKAMEFSPRRPFYLTLGLLGACVFGAIGYFWWQMQPPSNFRAVPQAARPPAAAPGTAQIAKAAPSPIGSSSTGSSSPGPSSPAPSPTGTAGVAAATAAVPSTALPQPGLVAVPDLTTKPPAMSVPSASNTATTTMTAPPTSTSAPIPAIPTLRMTDAAPARIATTPARPPVPAATFIAPAPPLTAALSATAPSAAARTAVAALPNSTFAITRPVRQIDPAVERGYAAFQRGDLEAARQEYIAALRNDSLSRDAHLGMAAIDIRTQNYESAEARYQRVLEIDPRDAHAQASLLGIRGFIDPVASESRTKSLIAQHPESAALHFTLGNQYAAQDRWRDAQSEYFKAFSIESENPDYAFNLAVSLDQIRQPTAALDYYKRALALARDRQAVFSREQVEARILALGR